MTDDRADGHAVGCHEGEDMKILIADAFAPSLPGKLARFGEVTDDASQLADADIVLVRSKTKCTAEYIDSAKGLKMIIRGGVGLDNIDQKHAKAKGIIVYNTAEASSIAVAEQAMALMLAMPNQVVRAHETMKQGIWAKKEIKRTELYRKTLGLLGAGRIATEVAKRAAAFGMKVIAFDPYVKTHPVAEMTASLDELLAASDYISIHTPLTEETKGMLGAQAIAKMKKGVRIVNTGRAKVVIEADMRAALESGHVAGYATDVWYSDPPEGSPLTDAPNVLMAPHIGASTTENLLRIGDIVETLIEQYVKERR
jgi:D-3-phosphoglycerate dehydrogenase